MTRLVIDTNILYSLVGLSENQRVNNSPIKESKLSIATPSLIEVISKHHNDLDSIKKCITPVLTEEIELINIGFAPISNEYLNRIKSADKIEDIKDIIDAVRDMKIDREALFYRLMLLIVASGLFEVIRDDGYKFNDDAKNNMQIMLIKSLLEANFNYILDTLKNELRNGYLNNNEQQVGLSAFETILRGLLEGFHENYHRIKTNSLDFAKDKDKIDVLRDSIENDNFAKKFKKYLDNPLKLASREKHKTLIDNHLEEMKKGISGASEMTDESLEYLIGKIEYAFKKNSKLRKNDIFDFLIVISLNMPETLILTLDKGFLRDLKNLHPASYKKCLDFGLVN